MRGIGTPLDFKPSEVSMIIHRLAARLMLVLAACLGAPCAFAVSASATLADFTFTVTSLDAGPAWITFGDGTPGSSGHSALYTEISAGGPATYSNHIEPGMFVPATLNSSAPGIAAQGNVTDSGLGSTVSINNVAATVTANTSTTSQVYLCCTQANIHYSPHSVLTISTQASTFAQVSEDCADAIGCGQAKAWVQIFGWTHADSHTKVDSFSSLVISGKVDLLSHNGTLSLSFVNPNDTEDQAYLLAYGNVWAQNMGPDYIRPVPEPTTYGLMLVGVAALALRSRRS